MIATYIFTSILICTRPCVIKIYLIYNKFGIRITLLEVREKRVLEYSLVDSHLFPKGHHFHFFTLTSLSLVKGDCQILILRVTH